MLSLNADVIGLSETHLNSRHTTTRNIVDDDFRRLWHNHKTIYSASNEHWDSRCIAQRSKGPYKLQQGNCPVALLPKAQMTWDGPVGNVSTHPIHNKWQSLQRTECVNTAPTQSVKRRHTCNSGEPFKLLVRHTQTPEPPSSRTWLSSLTQKRPKETKFCCNSTPTPFLVTMMSGAPSLQHAN